VFLQHICLKPFRPVLLFFTPVPAISDLYLILRSIHLDCDPLFSVLSYHTHRHALTHAAVFPRLFIRDPFDMALTRHL